MDGCHEQIKALENLINKLTLSDGAGLFEKGKKTLNSIRSDEKLERINKNIDGYVKALTLFLVATQSKSRQEPGRIIYSITCTFTTMLIRNSR